ncbi:MAG TPA: right-handed parallel beta-helix repeat-containing protein, partial [Candidatus Bilamarchaeaceae archaeon]|nr:right-handed parallel beta-helix repeat-containing protein [Candidatus Bilamarchaeaceae archaeon]
MIGGHKFLVAALLLLVGLSFAVDITACQVISAPGDYYIQPPGISTLGTPMQDCLVVQSDNVHIYCQGYHVRAPPDPSDEKPYPGYAIYIHGGYDNILVDGCVLEDSLSGLRVGDGTGNSGIMASHNTARNNVFNGFELAGVQNSDFNQNTFECTPIPGVGNGIGFRATNLSTSVIRNSISTNCGNGFHLASSSQNSLLGNSGTGAIGAALTIGSDSDDNIVEDFTATGNTVGISIVGFPEGSAEGAPDGNIFTGCALSGNAFACFQAV